MEEKQVENWTDMENMEESNVEWWKDMENMGKELENTEEK